MGLKRKLRNEGFSVAAGSLTGPNTTEGKGEEKGGIEGGHT